MIAAAPGPEFFLWCLAVFAFVSLVTFTLACGRIIWVMFTQPTEDDDDVEGCDADHVS